MRFWPCLLLLVPILGLFSIWFRKLRLPVLLLVVLWIGIVLGMFLLGYSSKYVCT